MHQYSSSDQEKTSSHQISLSLPLSMYWSQSQVSLQMDLSCGEIVSVRVFHWLALKPKKLDWYSSALWYVTYKYESFGSPTRDPIFIFFSQMLNYYYYMRNACAWPPPLIPLVLHVYDFSCCVIQLHHSLLASYGMGLFLVIWPYFLFWLHLNLAA